MFLIFNTNMRILYPEFFILRRMLLFFVCNLMFFNCFELLINVCFYISLH